VIIVLAILRVFPQFLFLSIFIFISFIFWNIYVSLGVSHLFAGHKNHMHMIQQNVEQICQEKESGIEHIFWPSVCAPQCTFQDFFCTQTHFIGQNLRHEFFQNLLQFFSKFAKSVACVLGRSSVLF